MLGKIEHVALAVADLDRAVYHYDPLDGLLERGRSEIGDLARAAPSADVMTTAGAVLLIAATFWRSRFKYGLRAYRFTLLEAGHVAQNALLACTALGLASVPLGGFYDHFLDALLGLDGVDQSVLYAVSIGRPAEAS